jgi:hypothetical protein
MRSDHNPKHAANDPGPGACASEYTPSPPPPRFALAFSRWACSHSSKCSSKSWSSPAPVAPPPLLRTRHRSVELHTTVLTHTRTATHARSPRVTWPPLCHAPCPQARACRPPWPRATRPSRLTARIGRRGSERSGWSGEGPGRRAGRKARDRRSPIESAARPGSTRPRGTCGPATAEGECGEWARRRDAQSRGLPRNAANAADACSLRPPTRHERRRLKHTHLHSPALHLHAHLHVQRGTSVRPPEEALKVRRARRVTQVDCRFDRSRPGALKHRSGHRCAGSQE